LFDNFKLLNIIKKNIDACNSRVSTWWLPCHLGGAWRPIQLPKSYFRNGVESGESSFFCRCGAFSWRRSDWVVMKFFSFFLLFSLIAYKFTSDLPKNNYVLQFVNLSMFALFFIIIITVYLAFNCFWSLSFFSISSLDILFNLIFLSSFFPLLLIVIFLCFILYYYYCNFIPSNFFVFVFLIHFLSSFFWLIYSYHFLDFFFNCLSTFNFIWFVYPVSVIILSITFFILFLSFFFQFSPDYFLSFFIPYLLCIVWVLNCFTI
jgi:hypothetical protein